MMIPVDQITPHIRACNAVVHVGAHVGAHVGGRCCHTPRIGWRGMGGEAIHQQGLAFGIENVAEDGMPIYRCPITGNQYRASRVGSKQEDLAGRSWGRWTVLAFYGRTGTSRNYRWICQCECGRIRPVLATHVRSGSTKSCGCVKSEMTAQRNRERGPSQRKHATDLDAVVAAKWGEANRSVPTRGHEFRLTYDQFRSLVTGSCHYCGSPGVMRYNVGPSGHGRRGAVINGIDRVDNLLGYIDGNCVPCCPDCNRAKHMLTLEAFREWHERLTRHRLAVDPGFADSIRGVLGC